MKTVALSVSIIFLWMTPAYSQSNSKAADHLIEGSKVIVELIKALSTKKGGNKSPDCKDAYADLCVSNESTVSMTASFSHRSQAEKRDLVILPGLRECALQAPIGIWTYDLRVTATNQPIRKGDLLIESCQNLTMSIKY